MRKKHFAAYVYAYLDLKWNNYEKCKLLTLRIYEFNDCKEIYMTHVKISEDMRRMKKLTKETENDGGE
ncbi:CLUMA_CG005230, isoform A [Clunio marinus]|uniref:CLUMA_CG005230, isoform A n=1 Tax=Clunio marinus TaxID=568069 RepID=A0A1J1HU26_9DIPT|nr:CLUMA_CG005230, isoform A [Clunio marinus]